MRCGGECGSHPRKAALQFASVPPAMFCCSVLPSSAKHSAASSRVWTAATLLPLWPQQPAAEEMSTSGLSASKPIHPNPFLQQQAVGGKAAAGCRSPKCPTAHRVGSLVVLEPTGFISKNGNASLVVGTTDGDSSSPSRRPALPRERDFAAPPAMGSPPLHIQGIRHHAGLEAFLMSPTQLLTPN